MNWNTTLKAELTRISFTLKSFFYTDKDRDLTDTNIESLSGTHMFQWMKATKLHSLLKNSGWSGLVRKGGREKLTIPTLPSSDTHPKKIRWSNFHSEKLGLSSTMGDLSMERRKLYNHAVYNKMCNFKPVGLESTYCPYKDHWSEYMDDHLDFGQTWSEIEK